MSEVNENKVRQNSSIKKVISISFKAKEADDIENYCKINNVSKATFLKDSVMKYILNYEE